MEQLLEVSMRLVRLSSYMIKYAIRCVNYNDAFPKLYIDTTIKSQVLTIYFHESIIYVELAIDLCKSRSTNQILAERGPVVIHQKHGLFIVNKHGRKKNQWFV